MEDHRPPLVAAGRVGAAGRPLTLAMQKPWQPRPVSYNAAMRFNVGITPERIPGVYTYDRYYTMLTSEYLVDDLGEIVRSQAFAAAVSARLADQGLVVPAGAIGANTQPGKLHRILTVNVGWGDEAQLRAIAEAIAATLTEGSAEFFGQFSADEADIRLIDPPTISQVGQSARRTARSTAARAVSAGCRHRTRLSVALSRHDRARARGVGADGPDSAGRDTEALTVRYHLRNKTGRSTAA